MMPYKVAGVWKKMVLMVKCEEGGICMHSVSMSQLCTHLTLTAPWLGILRGLMVFMEDLV